MRNYTIPIDENECIGDSLDTINANFETLDSGFNAAFVCERFGVGTIGQYMANGNGAGTHIGPVMPYNGELLKAGLQVHNATGTTTVQPAVNGVAYSNYQLTTTGTNLTGSQLSAYAAPLAFKAGDTLGWLQVSVPSSVNSYNVTYVVHFFM
jgi:hypothetical protein